MPGFGVLRPNRTISFFGVYVCMIWYSLMFWCFCFGVYVYVYVLCLQHTTKK